MIGIIGFGRIAQVHARIFIKNKKLPAAILVRSQESVDRANLFFEKNFAYIPKIIQTPNDFFELSLTRVILCTPPETHYKFLMKSFEYGLPVFCEKPLFWQNAMDFKDVEHFLMQIKKKVFTKFW